MTDSTPSNGSTTVVRRAVRPGAEASTTGRLDVVLVARGLARSRGHARDLVAAGSVRLEGVVATRPSSRVEPGADLAVDADEAWVGRAAHKLVAALDAFVPQGLRVADLRCLDVGASTGGFTQVLLDRGATSVMALDVGHGQLAASIADDPRVEERSGVNVREVGPPDLGGPFDLVVGDLSFISLTLVWEALAAQLRPGGEAVLLVKPQFEVGRAGLGKNGVVRSPAQRLRAVERVVASARAAGLGLRDMVVSPLPGGSGNREYLGWFTNDLAAALDPAPAADLVRSLDDRTAAEPRTEEP